MVNDAVTIDKQALSLSQPVASSAESRKIFNIRMGQGVAMTKDAKRRALKREEDARRYNITRIWGKRYAHMKARHDGKSTHRSGSLGKGIMSQDAFYDWCKRPENMADFLTIYFDWVQSGFSRWFSPSIDRKDSTKGYVAGNLKWLSYADNSEKNNKDPIMVRGVIIG